MPSDLPDSMAPAATTAASEAPPGEPPTPLATAGGSAPSSPAANRASAMVAWLVGAYVFAVLALAVSLLSLWMWAPAFAFSGRASTWPLTLAIFFISGALGGMLGPLQLPDVAELFRSSAPGDWTWYRVRNVALGLGISMAGGIGGAFAAMFVMILDNKIKPPTDDTQILTYCSTGLLAGFLGFQLLRLIAGNLFKNLGALQDTAKEAERKVEELRRLSDLRLAVLFGLYNLTDETARPSHIEEAIKLLEAALPNFPLERRGHIVLANLYGVRQKNYSKAIEILTHVVEAIDVSPRAAERALDRADIRFNLACYYSLLASAQSDPAQRAHFLDLSVDSLEKSLVLWPHNADLAEKDPDLDELRKNSRFQPLITIAKARY